MLIEHVSLKSSYDTIVFTVYSLFILKKIMSEISSYKF